MFSFYYLFLIIVTVRMSNEYFLNPSLKVLFKATGSHSLPRIRNIDIERYNYEG